MWPPNVTQMFIEECIKRKRGVQKDSIPLKVWKDVGAVLSSARHSNCNWQVCRDKFDGLNSFFSKTLLPLNGVIGDIKWPHYDSFCQLHDIPLDYDLQNDVVVEDGQEMSISNTPTKKGILLLLHWFIHSLSQDFSFAIVVIFLLHREEDLASSCGGATHQLVHLLATFAFDNLT